MNALRLVDRVSRILFIEQKDFFGGGQVYLVNLASLLQTRGFTSLVVSTPNNQLAVSLARRMVFHTQLQFGTIQKSSNPVIIFLNVFRRVIPTLRLIALIRRIGVDLVCANDVFSYLCSFPAARLTGKPIVLIAHMSRYPDSYFMRFILRGADAIVAVAPAVFEALEAIEPSISSRASVILTGIDPINLNRESSEELRRQWTTGAGSVVVGMIGRLSPEKGVDVLLQSAVEVTRARKNVKVVIVGDGPDAAALAELARRLGIESFVIFTGFREDIPVVLQALDVVVIPSFTEGLPLTLLEAMGAGKPVIASAVGGIPDVVRDGVNALLISPSDSGALARVLVSLIDDANRRSSLGENARATIEGKLTLTHMAAEYEKLFLSVIPTTQRRPE